MEYLDLLVAPSLQDTAKLTMLALLRERMVCQESGRFSKTLVDTNITWDLEIHLSDHLKNSFDYSFPGLKIACPLATPSKSELMETRTHLLRLRAP
jgi:hypothetical protein